MNSKMFNFLLLLLAGMNFILCSSSLHNSVIKKSEKDDQGTVRLTPGDTLKVVLNENLSTGYKWEIISIDTCRLTMIHSEYLPDKENMKIMGRGGKVIKLFKARNKGESELRLICKRSFGKEDSVVKKFKLTVIIE